MTKPELPPPDIFRDYDLLQAYLKLAQRMFPRQWTRNNCELQTADNSELLAVKSAEKKEIENRLTELEAEHENLDAIIKKNTDENIVADARIKRDEISSERSTLYARRAQLPDIPGLERDAELFQRRMAVEEKLINGLIKEEFGIWCMFGFPLDRGPWENRDGYHYDIMLSTVWWHRRAHGKRRQFVRVYRDVFDDWLKTVAPNDAKHIETLPREDRARLLAEQIIHNPSPARLKRSSFIDQLQAETGISRKKAAMLWDGVVPSHRKLAGRPRAESGNEEDA